MSVNTDTLNCNLCPDFIQCGGTSFNFLPLSQDQPARKTFFFTFKPIDNQVTTATRGESGCPG